MIGFQDFVIDMQIAWCGEKTCECRGALVEKAGGPLTTHFRHMTYGSRLGALRRGGAGREDQVTGSSATVDGRDLLMG